MRLTAGLALIAAIASLGASLAASPALALSPSTVTQTAIASDPAPDPKYPARLEVLHIPSGGVEINGIALVASGAGPHPTLVLFHGLPGNEKNLDLAQAVRRAGWTVVTINYRGSWGSPGQYRFAQDLEDADATLAYIRDPANAAKLGIDPTRIALAGHSLGGWVTAETAAHDKKILGAVMISAGDMGFAGFGALQARPQIVAFMNDSRESLAGVTGDSMADELAAHAAEWSFAAAAPKLVDTRLLVLYGDDFVTSHSTGLVDRIQKAGGTKMTAVHVATDHSWSDHRIALETLVIDWLLALPK